MKHEADLIKHAHIQVNSKKITSNGYTINYIKQGNGKPLLLIHGINIGWGQWYKNINDLSKYFCVYALDLPGAGQSSAIDVNNINIKKNFIDTIKSFISNQQLKEVSIVCHSISAVFCLRYALENTQLINKIVLVSPLGITNNLPWNQRLLAVKPFVTLLTKTIMRPTSKNVQKFLKSVTYNKQDVEKEYLNYYYKGISEKSIVHPFIFMSRFTTLSGLAPELMIRDDLETFNKEVLLIFGEEDPIIPVQKIRREYLFPNNVKLITFPKTGHIPPIEKAKTFNNYVVEYLKK